MGKIDLVQHAVNQELLRVHKARKGILNYTKFTKPDYSINWHHRVIAKELNAFIYGETQFLMIFTPPRHGKSELVSRRLPSMWHGIYPNDEIMAVSYSGDLANDMTRDVQIIMESPSYSVLFPETKIPTLTQKHGIRNSEEHTIIGQPKGRYKGQGVGGSFTGKGANLIVIDDPIKGREQADSPTFREKVWKFYQDDLYSRLEKNIETGRDGQILLTVTRWHEDDLAGRIIKLMQKDSSAPQFRIVTLPAIKTDQNNDYDPRATGEALWPEKFDLEALARIRANQTATGGVRGWSSLYQQQPIPDGGAMFQEKMFEFTEVPQLNSYDYIFTTADTAYNDKRHNDYTVFCVWGVIGEELFLIACWREQIQSNKVENIARAFLSGFMVYGYRNTWIEPKGHGIYLNQKFSEEGLGIPSENDLKEFYKDRRHDKIQRANNVLPHLANKRVKINKTLANKEEILAETLGFPNAKHDDFVDCLIDALKHVYGRKLSILDVL